MRGFPIWKYVVMGALDSLAGILMVRFCACTVFDCTLFFGMRPSTDSSSFSMFECATWSPPPFPNVTISLSLRLCRRFGVLEGLVLVKIGWIFFGVVLALVKIGEICRSAVQTEENFPICQMADSFFLHLLVKLA